MTLVSLYSVSQLDSGGEFKDGFVNLFQVSPEGWLYEKPQYISKSFKPYAIKSGTYYLKGMDRPDGFAATGTIHIKPGVTNIISISIE